MGSPVALSIAYLFMILWENRYIFNKIHNPFLKIYILVFKCFIDYFFPAFHKPEKVQYLLCLNYYK